MSGAGLLPAPARASRVRGSRSQPFANAQSQQTAVLLVFACAPKAVGKALAPQPCPNRLRPLRRWTPADPVSGLWEPTAATPFVGSSAHYVGSLRDKSASRLGRCDAYASSPSSTCQTEYRFSQSQTVVWHVLQHSHGLGTKTLRR